MASEAAIYIENVHQEYRHSYLPLQNSAVYRTPIALPEIWDDFILDETNLPLVPAAGLINDGDTDGDVRIRVNRSLSLVAGSTTKYELRDDPITDLTQVIPATFGATSELPGPYAPKII